MGQAGRLACFFRFKVLRWGHATRAASLAQNGAGCVWVWTRRDARRLSIALPVVSGGACGPVQVVSMAQRTRWAVAKMALYGQPDAMANLIRRTLTVTRAPILNSLRRTVPQVASARSVVCKARRRRPLTRTYAIEANHRRSWLAAMVPVEVRSAHRPISHSLTRFSTSPPPP